MNEELLKELNGKLDILISLQATNLLQGKNTRESIDLLDRAGLKAPVIANILTKKPGFIHKELSIVRNKR